MFSTPFTSCSIGRGDGVGDDLRAGAGIGRRDLHRRRDDLRVLRDRQRRAGRRRPMMTMTIERTVAKIGPVDEEAREHRPAPTDSAFGRRRGAARRARGACSPSAARPSRPGARAGCRSRSPTRRARAPRPRRGARRAAPPSFTGRYSTTFLSFTTSTYFRSWSVPIARSVTRSAGLRLAHGHAHADEQARRQEPVRVRQDRAHVDRAGRRVDLVVDEVDRALVREVGLVGERDEDRERRRRGRSRAWPRRRARSSPSGGG